MNGHWSGVKSRFQIDEKLTFSGTSCQGLDGKSTNGEEGRHDRRSGPCCVQDRHPWFEEEDATRTMGIFVRQVGETRFNFELGLDVICYQNEQQRAKQTHLSYISWLKTAFSVSASAGFYEFGEPQSR